MNPYDIDPLKRYLANAIEDTLLRLQCTFNYVLKDAQDPKSISNQLQNEIEKITDLVRYVQKRVDDGNTWLACGWTRLDGARPIWTRLPNHEPIPFIAATGTPEIGYTTSYSTWFEDLDGNKSNHQDFDTFAEAAAAMRYHRHIESGEDY